MLFNALLPDALGPLGLCGIKLVLFDLPVLQVLIRMVVDLESMAMVEQFADGGPGEVSGLGVGESMGQRVYRAHKGMHVIYQLAFIVDGDTSASYANLHTALFIEQFLHMAQCMHNRESFKPRGTPLWYIP